MIDTAFDFALSLLLFFLVLSLAASAVNEAVARLFALRSRHLWRTLREMVDDTSPSYREGARPATASAAGSPGAGDIRTLTQQLYDHPLVRKLEGRAKGAKARLAYIPQDTFARALIGIVTDDAPDATVAAFKERLAMLAPDSDLSRSLNTLIAEAGGSLAVLRSDIGQWFDEGMNSLSRRYRLHMKWVLFAIGLVLAVLLNANTLHAADKFYRDGPARSALARQAEKIADECATADLACVETKVDQVQESLDLPIGWEGSPKIDAWSVIGWILTAAAISQGAAFWFDLLRRAKRLRSEE